MNILFVCHGNINRSAAAEWISKHLIQTHPEKYNNFNIASSGIRVRAKSMSKGMREVFENHNVEQNHTAQRIDSQLINWADKIVYMDRGNKNNILKYYPDIDQSKLVNLGDYVTDPNLIPYSEKKYGRAIPDPNYNSELLEPVFNMIYNACEELLGSSNND